MRATSRVRLFLAALAGEIDRIGRLTVRIRLREGYDMGLGRVEYGVEQVDEFGVRGIVGPQPEKPYGVEFVSQVFECWRGIESAVFRRCYPNFCATFEIQKGGFCIGQNSLRVMIAIQSPRLG